MGRGNVLPETSPTKDTSHKSNSGYDTVSPTVRRHGDSAPAALMCSVPQRRSGPDFLYHHLHRELLLPSLPEPTSTSWPLHSSVMTEYIHRYAPPTVSSNTYMPLRQTTDPNASICNWSGYQPSLLSAEPPLWPYAPPPHTYGRPIPLPPVDDDDKVFPINYTNLCPVRPDTKAESLTPPGLPWPAVAHRNNSPVECACYPSGAAGVTKDFDSGNIKWQAVCDWTGNAGPSESSTCCNGGNASCSSSNGAHPGSDRRCIEKWRRSIR